MGSKVDEKKCGLNTQGKKDRLMGNMIRVSVRDTHEEKTSQLTRGQQSILRRTPQA